MLSGHTLGRYWQVRIILSFISKFTSGGSARWRLGEVRKGDAELRYHPLGRADEHSLRWSHCGTEIPS